MEAPGLAKAAAVDPDPPKSTGETPDEAPAQVPGSDTPASESPTYRLQDFDTLATVGECETWGPGPQGRSAPPGTRASDKAPGVSSPGCLLWSSPPGPACSGALAPTDARRVGVSPPGPRVPPLASSAPPGASKGTLFIPATVKPLRCLGSPTSQKFLELTSHWGPQAPSQAGTPRGRGGHWGGGQALLRRMAGGSVEGGPWNELLWAQVFRGAMGWGLWGWISRFLEPPWLFVLCILNLPSFLQT